MFQLIVMLWILIHLQAPTWCYALLGICMIIRAIEFCCGLYKAGKEADK